MFVKAKWVITYRDEDFGAEQSVFVDFFGTYKATLPGLNKMAKLSKAVVIPMFPRYNAETGKYEMEIHPAMNLSDDPEQSARAMNEEIESFVTPSRAICLDFAIIAYKERW